MDKNFKDIISAWYKFSWEYFPIGVATHGWEICTDTIVTVPLSTLNRHGLVAGATWTGKTKTIQKILENLSFNGIPSIMMDMKGDISGLAMPWELSEKLEKYIQKFGSDFSWNPEWFPVEFFSLSWEGGSQIRATITEFGPMLLSRVLWLSDVQSSALSVIFRYADENGLLLVDLEDLKTLLSYLSQYGKQELINFGQISPTTMQVIMRQIIQLESQWMKEFFAEKSLDITDLMQLHDWRGQINIFRLMNSIRYPALFSTAMIQLLLEVFYLLPEVWDKWKPKMVFVIDEAHLLFKDLSLDLLAELEMVIKLVRSKWVGIIFCTQNPNDIPESILSQLWLKVQHALRAFTAKDQENIKKISKNFPVTSYYNIEEELINLGIGEAFVTLIGEDGKPTPLVVTKIFPPQSRMDTISHEELLSFLSISSLFSKYQYSVNPESATEILSQKIMQIQQQKSLVEEERQRMLEERERKRNPSFTDSMIQTATKTIGTHLARSIATKIWGKQIWSIGAEIARWLLGSIFK